MHKSTIVLFTEELVSKNAIKITSPESIVMHSIQLLRLSLDYMSH